MDSIIALVEELGNRDQPMLTWYGGDQERVDLTGRTTANWIIKAANLLSLELDCHAGTQVWLSLPWHWRAIVWAHAIWATEGQIALSPEGAELAVTSHPQEAHADLETIVVPLPALARAVDDLPPWAIDGAADLMTQADVWAFHARVSQALPTGLGIRQQDLLDAADPLAGARATGHGGPSRLLLLGRNLAAGLPLVAQAWAKGIGVVLADDEQVGDLEGVTHVLDLETRELANNTDSSPIPRD